MYFLKGTQWKVLLERRRYNRRGQTLRHVEKIRDQYKASEFRSRRTNLLRISFLRGLFDAKITRFPESFFMLGILRACERTELCFEGIFAEAINSS
jgi:hypothetical protein